jgi:hypothetical protein
VGFAITCISPTRGHVDHLRVLVCLETPSLFGDNAYSAPWRVACSRAGREALGLGNAGGRLVRRAVLGGDGRRWSAGASGPQPPSLRRPCGRGLGTSDGVARWTGSGLAALTRLRLPDDRTLPAWLDGHHAPPRGPGGPCWLPCRGDRRRRGAGSQAEGPPPADEEEPEQQEASPPETPGPVMPAAPLLQERRDVVERGRGAHGLCSSRWGSPDGAPWPWPVVSACGAPRGRARPLCLPQDPRGHRGARLSQASPGVLDTLYQPHGYLSSILTMNAGERRERGTLKSLTIGVCRPSWGPVGSLSRLQRSVGNQVILVYLQPLAALSPFRARNMGDQPCRIAQVDDHGGEGVCRMVTEGKVGGIS